MALFDLAVDLLGHTISIINKTDGSTTTDTYAMPSVTYTTTDVPGWVAPWGVVLEQLRWLPQSGRYTETAMIAVVKQSVTVFRGSEVLDGSITYDVAHVLTPSFYMGDQYKLLALNEKVS